MPKITERVCNNSAKTKGTVMAEKAGVIMTETSGNINGSLLQQLRAKNAETVISEGQ